MPTAWSKPFASEHHELVTRLRPAECERRLLAQITSGLGRSSRATTNTVGESTYPSARSAVWGIASEGTFTLHRSLRQRDAFKTIATGTLEPYRAGTRLDVTLQPSPVGIIALAAVPLLLLFWSALFLALFLSPSMQALLGVVGGLAIAIFGSIVLLLWFALVYVIWRWLSAGPDHFLLDFLCATLDAKEAMVDAQERPPQKTEVI